MATIFVTIDEKKIEVDSSKTILDECKDNDISRRNTKKKLDNNSN